MQCYLCSGTEFLHREGSVRDAPSLQILECLQCGLVTLSSHAHISPEHYAQSGMHGDDIPSIDAWLKDSATDDERRFEHLKPYLVNRSVLDFGCGAGGFLEREGRIQVFWGNRLR